MLSIESSGAGKRTLNTPIRNMHHLGITPLLSLVWIGYEYCVDRKNTKNSDLLPLLVFSTEDSYW